MGIDWATLVMIAVVAAGAAVSVVLLVAFAVVGFSPASGERIDGDDDGGASGTRIGSVGAGRRHVIPLRCASARPAPTERRAVHVSRR